MAQALKDHWSDTFSRLVDWTVTAGGLGSKTMLLAQVVSRLPLNHWCAMIRSGSFAGRTCGALSRRRRLLRLDQMG
eukprot:1230870-Pyramimonas_sp.AAC.1